jgi:hypothetical protein
VRTSLAIGAVGVVTLCTAGSFVPAAARAGRQTPRDDAIARARVWMPTRVSAVDIKAGPQDRNGFPFLATVECRYVDKVQTGRSPKFACVRDGDDELKVKYGADNGEVYGEVAATRLLWALGFGADSMYPARVVCRDCPRGVDGAPRGEGRVVFDPASVERKLPADEFPAGIGWSWSELDKVDEEAGGAPRAHRDALKLLAVFMQHTDNKPEQQRLVCLDGFVGGECRRPFMLLQDVGLTFGRWHPLNFNTMAGMNLDAWSSTTVWKGSSGCVGNLPKSVTGTLGDPEISEEGRLFLAKLLQQLSDRQIRDLFETARVTLRLRSPGNATSGFGTVDEWTQVFKRKRDEIASRSCA